MGPAATMASGILVGVILFLSMALVGVIAVNGTDNPGFTPDSGSAAAGSTAELPDDQESRALTNGSFGSLDLNADRRVSLAEAAGHAEIVTRFDRADRNRDGKLTQREFDRLAKLPPAKAAKKARAAKKEPRRSAPTAAAGG